MPKLSIIVPVYNAEKYLFRCLNSLIEQVLEDIEIIIIDDGSTDNSYDIIQSFTKQFPYIHYYKKEHSGVADTRNLGISESSGDYIMFVDADDYLSTDFGNCILPYINTNIDLIKFKLKKVSTLNKEISKIDGPVFNKISGQEAFNILYSKDILLDSPCIYLMKKTLFTKNHLFFKGMYHEDFGLIPLLYLVSQHVISLPYYLYCYVESDNSITRNQDYNKTLQKMNDVLFQYDNMLQEIKNFDINKITLENIKIYYSNAVILKLNELNETDRKIYIEKIKARKLYKNIKARNFKQLLKKFILYVDINLYLKLR